MVQSNEGSTPSLSANLGKTKSVYSNYVGSNPIYSAKNWNGSQVVKGTSLLNLHKNKNTFKIFPELLRVVSWEAKIKITHIEIQSIPHRSKPNI